MTREEAIERAYNNETEHLIDTIYDDFESRTCESCRFCEDGSHCELADNAYMLGERLFKATVNEKMSCVLWEKKDD